ncbi:MAG: ABC transporter permease [Gemmatimonadota bacterium]
MIAPVLRGEWRLALRRRRLFALNAGIPLLLVLPLALGAAPPTHAAVVYTVLFVLFGTMGSAIPLLREGEAGLLRRMVLTGYPPARILLERIVAGTAVDMLQLAPAILLIVLFAPGAGGRELLLLSLGLGVALAAANLVGVWVAAVARSLAEGALFAAVVSLLLLHGAGVFRTPVPGSWAARIEPLLPFLPLHHKLLEITTGRSAATGAGGAGGGFWSGTVIEWGSGVSTALVLLFLTAGAATSIAEWISAEGRG